MIELTKTVEALIYLINELKNGKTTEGNDRIYNETQEYNNKPSSNTTSEKNVKELGRPGSFNLYDIDEDIIKESALTRVQSPESPDSFVDTVDNVSISNNSISQDNKIDK